MQIFLQFLTFFRQHFCSEWFRAATVKHDVQSRSVLFFSDYFGLWQTGLVHLYMCRVSSWDREALLVHLLYGVISCWSWGSQMKVTQASLDLCTLQCCLPLRWQWRWKALTASGCGSAFTALLVLSSSLLWGFTRPRNHFSSVAQKLFKPPSLAVQSAFTNWSRCIVLFFFL